MHVIYCVNLLETNELYIHRFEDPRYEVVYTLLTLRSRAVTVTTYRTIYIKLILLYINACGLICYNLQKILFIHGSAYSVRYVQPDF